MYGCACFLYRWQISCDVFFFSDSYTDVCTIGQLASNSAGSVYYYPNFDMSRDGDKFASELTRNLSSETGWESVVRIRASKGVQISNFQGSFFMRAHDLMALPVINSDQSITAQLRNDETVLSNPMMSIQCALLYTTSAGERRIRLLRGPLSFPVSVI